MATSRTKENSRTRLFLIFILVFVGLVCLGFYIFTQWFSEPYYGEFLPVSIQTDERANYQAGPRRSRPPVSLKIVSDILEDVLPLGSDITIYMDTFQSQLLTPIPTVTPVPITDTPTITLTTTNNPLLTNTPAQTQTPTITLQYTYTPTQTPTPTITLQYTYTPTQTPTPTNTLQYTYTPTQTPIPTNTLQYTYTPTQTPIPTNTPTQTPIPTNTPVPTATPIPPTPTTSSCSAPGSSGFVSSFNPSGGSTGVSVDVNPVIRFNQAMNASTLTYGKMSIALCTNSGCGTIVSGSISISSTSYANDTVTIFPTSSLDGGLIYYINAGKDVENSCGTNQGGLFVVSDFTTQ